MDGVGISARFRPNEAWSPLSLRHGLRDVSGVATDSAGRLFATARDGIPVMVFTPDGELVDTWPADSVGGVHGITIGPDDTVYLTDHIDHVVRVFEPDGALTRIIGTAGVASETGYDPGASPVRQAAGPFNRPTNVAIDADGSILVADGYGNARIHRFDPSGTLVDSWGTPGSGPGQFNLPHGIAVAGDGTVLVADRENSRVLLFSGDGQQIEEWTFVNRPSDLAIGTDGLVYLSELSVPLSPPPAPHQRYAEIPRPGAGRHARITICSVDGTVVGRLGDSRAEAPGSFISPHGICVDRSGNLYVGELAGTIGRRDGVAEAKQPALRRFDRVTATEGGQ